MLRPSKHAHPDKTVIGIAIVVLKRMEVSHVVGYDELLDYVERRVDGGRYLYLPALNLLFLLGAIEYHRKNDAFELVGMR